MNKDVWSLEVFRRAYALSLEVHRASQEFPKIGAVWRHGRPAAAIVEVGLRAPCGGCGRQARSDTEFRRYVMMALGSVEETKLWTVYARDLGYVEGRVQAAWQAGYAEIARMLQGLLRKPSCSLAKSDD
jgi:hypothetical protein